MGKHALVGIVLLLAGCASAAETRVQRAVEAVGGLDRLRAVAEYRVDSRLAVSMDTSVDGEPRGSEPTHFTSREVFRRPAEWHSRTVMPVFDVSMDTVIDPRRGPRRSFDAGETWTELDHVHGSAARLRARVDASLVLPDILLADDVELRIAEPVLAAGVSRPAVSARFGDLPAVIYAFDEATGRIERALIPALPGVAGADAVIVLGDWRDVDGILVAHEQLDPRPEKTYRASITTLQLREKATTGDIFSPAPEAAAR